MGRIARAVVRRFRRQGAKECTCQRGCFAVVSDLPIKRLTQATRKGQSKLAAEQGNLAGPIHPYQAARGESSHRKGITPRGRRRPPPFQSRRRPGKRAWQRVKMGRWSKSKAPRLRTARRQTIWDSWQVDCGVPLRGSLWDVLNQLVNRRPLRSPSKPGQTAGK